MLNLRSYDTITVKGGTAENVLKTKIQKRRRVLQRHVLHFKGQDWLGEAKTIFSEAQFNCAAGIFTVLRLPGIWVM